MRILKYPIEILDRQSLILPRGFRLLDAQPQNGVLCLWAVVPEPGDTEEPFSSVDVVIRIVGTGNSLPQDQLTYLNTVQMPPFVWHIFYKG